MIIRKTYNDGAVKYFNRFTGKEVKLLRVGWVSGHKLPDYVFRYISPGQTAIQRAEDGSSMPSLSFNRNNARGNKFTPAKKKRTPQKH